MKIEIIPCLQDNYSYLIIDENKNDACVVDPSEAKPIINFIEKENINLKYILNTHHHFDHIGGNIELKEKYDSIVVGYKYDAERIPEINVLVEDNQIWKEDNFEAKIIHIPGHTTGHIAFYFFNEKIIFTGDTLFSLGCGKIFEGTYKEMFESLSKIKNLPEDTKIYCGHEYTLQNSKFCIEHDPQNQDLQKKITKINQKLKNNVPTIPSILKDEKECNIFLRAKNVESFSKLRDLKDNF
ncbi:hydroxyacylglutathione hydrolase [Candidatus Pelagibacter sp.]|nr:hydroxyacylglutathione hydrolase [Candidatus Pelagibacter sp.]MDC0642728.1 hydroxyacylglutathione hydrolase [Candidatus Pelagibacter sp.]